MSGAGQAGEAGTSAAHTQAPGSTCTAEPWEHELPAPDPATWLVQENQEKLEELARQLEEAAEVRTWTERVELVRRCTLWGPVLEARGAAAGLANQLAFVFPQHTTAVSPPPCHGLFAAAQAGRLVQGPALLSAAHQCFECA